MDRNGSNRLRKSGSGAVSATAEWQETRLVQVEPVPVGTTLDSNEMWAVGEKLPTVDKVNVRGGDGVVLVKDSGGPFNAGSGFYRVKGKITGIQGGGNIS